MSESKLLSGIDSAAEVSHPHESAHLHVSGEADYVDDIAEVSGTLFAALGLSEKACAKIVSIDLSAVEKSPGVVAILSCKDIPGDNDCGPIQHDDPILAEEFVQYIGQPVFVVVAETYMQARRAVPRADIVYEVMDPILNPLQARDKNALVVPPMHLQRGDPEDRLTSSPRRIKGEFSVGGQEQFYLEGQISYAVPKEDRQLLVYCSTQHPTEMQHAVAHATQRHFNQVVVETRRMGGGFGGKESQSALFACVASICADKLQRPVKLRLDRDDDILITGKRHCFHYSYDVGFDNQGRILAAKVEMTSRAGFSTDLSPPVATRAICHFDNAYFLSDVDIRAFCARTNTQSNTAFRGFGGPQGAIAIEYMIDNIARELGEDPLAVRKLNFYRKHERNTAPYGQVIEDNVIEDLVAELEDSSEYLSRRAEIRNFNKTDSILKKGIALTPVKFGISFNVVHFNQAGALVHIYVDGSILVNHGGTEMGQGLNTKVAQIVAQTLGVNLHRVRATATDTSKCANTSATAASTGADLNGKAAENAALRIRDRLAKFAAGKYGGSHENVIFASDRVEINGQSVTFQDLVSEAYYSRIQLWSDGFYKTPKLHWDRDTLTGRPFFYYAYGAAVSEVIVDGLTGEWKLLRVDLLHDAGNSINPAIDKGQIEGAFIQGMGWLTTEELWWNEQGKLMTHSPSTYKIPALNDCPDDFRVNLFHNKNHEDTILRSKAVGEPPLLLGFSAFFAIRDAISSIDDYRKNPPLMAPATHESILTAIASLRNEDPGREPGS